VPIGNERGNAVHALSPPVDSEYVDIADDDAGRDARFGRDETMRREKVLPINDRRDVAFLP
jgi:hypothetical protein